MTQPQTVYRQVIDFGVDGDIRFLAHRDMLRLFARAALRAGLPIRYSQGFNPHPRLLLPLPRPLAVASDAERLVIHLTDPVEPEQTLERLQEQLPAGIRLIRAWTLEPQQRCLPVKAKYRVEVAVVNRRAASSRAAAMLDPSPIQVARTNPKTGKVKHVDIRPFIQKLTVSDGCVEMELRIVDGTSARPDEVVAALGLEAGRINHRVRRLEVEWQ